MPKKMCASCSTTLRRDLRNLSNLPTPPLNLTRLHLEMLQHCDADWMGLDMPTMSGLNLQDHKFGGEHWSGVSSQHHELWTSTPIAPTVAKHPEGSNAYLSKILANCCLSERAAAAGPHRRLDFLSS